MTHNTITVNDVHNFEWFETRKEAMKRVTELQKIGTDVKWGGKKARSWSNYIDIRNAAIYQDKFNSIDMPWVVAW